MWLQRHIESLLLMLQHRLRNRMLRHSCCAALGSVAYFMCTLAILVFLLEWLYLLCSLDCVTYVLIPVGSLPSHSRLIDQLISKNANVPEQVSQFVLWLLSMVTLCVLTVNCKRNKGNISALCWCYYKQETKVVAILCQRNPNAICRGTREDEGHDPSLWAYLLNSSYLLCFMELKPNLSSPWAR